MFEHIFLRLYGRKQIAVSTNGRKFPQNHHGYFATCHPCAHHKVLHGSVITVNEYVLSYEVCPKAFIFGLTMEKRLPSDLSPYPKSLGFTVNVDEE